VIWHRAVDGRSERSLKVWATLAQALSEPSPNLLI
jgi:hypothetical protein